ncbi:MAG: hypothetical protein Q9166_002125 [cf. Caloplaca sp. 2 TL-2023]
MRPPRLLGFCNAGKATLTDYNARSSKLSYQPPPNYLDGQEGNIAQRPIFAEAHITYVHNFILCHPSSFEAPELGSYYLNQLILDASKWTLELHNEIWIFDQSFWQKSRELWQSAQDADWDDVILDEAMKSSVRDDIEGFFEKREQYQRYSIPWKRGIIFHGPPGNGKTISIRAIMKTLYSFSPPVASLYVKSFGYNPEYGIRRVFQKARATAPCLLILEDEDSLITPSTRSYFLNEVDGLEKNDGVLMVGSTNYLNLLDPSVSRRPSRFDRKYLFPAPSTPQRTQYCQYWRAKLASKNPDIQLPEELCPKIAEITDKFSFAYMKEAFVVTLLGLLVGRKNIVGKDVVEGAVEKGWHWDFEKLPLWREMKKQVMILREELAAGK